MRDDLLGARASVDWAVAQIPTLAERFAAWAATRPYEIVMEDDPETGDKLMVAYMHDSLPAIVVAEAGIILNAIRSSLDILAASLAARFSGVKTSVDVHFPIYGSIHDFMDPLEHVKAKKLFAEADIAKIKSLKPYHRGDEWLWRLHKLDVMRKHYRLITAEVPVQTFQMNASLAKTVQVWERTDNKTIILRCAPTDYRPDKNNTNLTLEITFNEPTLEIVHAPVVPVLRGFATRASEIIGMFDE